MSKKLIFIISLVIATLSLGTPAHVAYAEEVINGTISEPIDTPVSVVDDNNITPEPTTPIENPDDTPAEVAPSVSDNQTSEPINQTTDDNQDENLFLEVKEYIEEAIDLDPETWPLVLSAAALVLTIIFIVIINLVTHRKSRKIREENSLQ